MTDGQASDHSSLSVAKDGSRPKKIHLFCLAKQAKLDYVVTTTWSLFLYHPPNLVANAGGGRLFITCS